MLTDPAAVILSGVKNPAKAALITLLRQRAVRFECKVSARVRRDPLGAVNGRVGIK
jgi:hypothetical protein